MRLAVTLGLAFVAACSTPTSAPYYDDSVQAPLNFSFSTEPPANGGPVALDATIVITMDDFPDPDTVSFGPVLLRSGKANFDSVITVDLVHQSIRIRGRAPFQAGTTYDVVIDTTVAGLDQRVPAATTTFNFTTGSAKANLPPPAPVSWSMVEPYLSTHEPNPPCPTSASQLPQKGCAPFCHTTCGQSGDARAPTRGLDLSDPTDPVYGLINVPSSGLVGTEAAIPRVLPGDAARSTLMRKLLGGGQLPNPPLDAPYPMIRVDGKRMPLGTCVVLDPTTDQCDAPLDATDYFQHPLPFGVLELIERWIDGGALL
jgi:hypothetical protein